MTLEWQFKEGLSISTLQIEEAELQEKLKKTIMDFQQQVMDGCVELSVNRVLQTLPAAIGNWIQTTLKISNLGEIQTVYNETFLKAVEEHRGTVEPSLWKEFVDTVEMKLGDFCKPQLDEVQKVMEEFILRMDEGLVENGCYVQEDGLKEIGDKIWKQLEATIEDTLPIKQVVHAIFEELMSMYKLRNEKILNAEKHYANKIIKQILEAYDRQMIRMSNTPPFLHQAIHSSLTENFIRVFLQCYTAETSGVAEIQYAEKKNLEMKIQQQFEIHRKRNDLNAQHNIDFNVKEFQKSKDGYLKELQEFQKIPVDTTGANWLKSYAEARDRLLRILNAEVELELYSEKPKADDDYLDWRTSQSKLDKSFWTDSGIEKETFISSEKRMSILRPQMEQFFHTEINRIIEEEHCSSFCSTFTNLTKKCAEGFKAGMLPLAHPNDSIPPQLQSETMVLVNRFNQTWAFYEEKLKAKENEIQLKVKQIRKSLKEEYKENMSSLLKQHGGRVDETTLQNLHVSTVNELKKLMEIEMRKKVPKFQNTEEAWRLLEKRIGEDYQKFLKNTKQTLNKH